MTSIGMRRTFSSDILQVLFADNVYRYFTIMEPWVLSKALKNSEDVTSEEYGATKERLDTVLYLAIDAARMSGQCSLC